MAFKKILLHIGVEKTGSTSIQQACLNNQHTLSEANCFFPASVGKGNHTKLAIYAANYQHGLAKRFLNVNSEEEMVLWRERLQEEFLAELQTSNAELLILSCEWLAHLLKEAVEFKRLIDLLTTLTNNIEVALYIRRQNELAVSRYSTALKAGHTHPFTFPLTPTSESGLYDFLGIYQKWKKHLPVVTLRTFDRTHLYKQDLLADFFHLCGLDHEEICRDTPIRIDNPSLSREGQQLLTEFNKLVTDNFKDVLTEDRKKDRATRNFRLMIGQLMPGKYQPCAKTEAMAFADMFKESNEVLRKAEFPHRDQLFAQDFSKYAD